MCFDGSRALNEVNFTARRNIDLVVNSSYEASFKGEPRREKRGG
jgi:hypothetical protein